MPAFLIPAALGVASAIGNALANRKKARTAESTSQQKQSFNTSESSTASRVLRPEQENALGMIDSRMRDLYNPGASLEPIRAAMRSSVNRKYSGLPGAVAAKTMAHGAASGQTGQGVLQGELARLGELGGVDSSVAQMGLAQQAQGDNLLMQLLGQNFGMTTSGTRSGTSEGTSSGTQVAPGDPAAAGMMGGVDTLATLFGLSQMGKSGGGSSSPSSTDLGSIFRFLR